MQEQMLAYANRRAEAIRHEIRGGSPRTFDVVNRKWLVAKNGDIYNYTLLRSQAPPVKRPLRLQVQSGRQFAEPHRRTYVSHAEYAPDRPGIVWLSERGMGSLFQRCG